MKCPICGLTNPDSAIKCDCGYDFENGTMKESYPNVNHRIIAYSVAILVFLGISATLVYYGVKRDYYRKETIQIESRYRANPARDLEALDDNWRLLAALNREVRDIAKKVALDESIRRARIVTAIYAGFVAIGGTILLVFVRRKIRDQHYKFLSFLKGG